MIRRRKPAEAPEPDRLHFNDPLGTIKGQSKPTRPANPVETYTMSAEGEPLEAQTTDMPSNIRFHGGYLEGKEFDTPPGSDRGHLYRMGVRHYSPALGRFLQRDPLINVGLVNESFPLSANPYSYALNHPTELTDASGLQPCAGGCAEGLLGGLWEQIKTHFGAVDRDLECEIAWPEESLCWCRTNQGCCVYKGGNSAFTDPCLSGNILPLYCPPWAWRAERCFEWCCEKARDLKKHAPSEDGAAGGKGKRAPKLGHHGTGGDRVWVSQASASAPIDLIMFTCSAFTTDSFISRRALNANISGASHQSFLMFSSSLLVVGAIAGGAVAFSAAATVGIAALCSLLKAEGCRTSKLIRCLCEACNAFTRCGTYVGVGLAVAAVIVVIIGGVEFLVPIGVVSCFIMTPCVALAEYHAAQCFIKYGFE